MQCLSRFLFSGFLAHSSNEILEFCKSIDEPVKDGRRGKQQLLTVWPFPHYKDFFSVRHLLFKQACHTLIKEKALRIGDINPGRCFFSVFRAAGPPGPAYRPRPELRPYCPVYSIHSDSASDLLSALHSHPDQKKTGLE